MVTYLTDTKHFSNAGAAQAVSTWYGLTLIMPLLVAPMADHLWQHYPTILTSSFFFVMGLLALTMTTLEGALSIHVSKSASTTFLFGSLALISLGVGGYSPSLQAFGADQLGDDEESLPSKQTEDEKTSIASKKTLFFNWWFFGVCTGCLLGVAVMSYLQDTIGWPLGFGIPTSTMVASVLLFVSGTRFYAFKAPKRSRDNHEPPHEEGVVDGIVGQSNGKGNVQDLEMEENRTPRQSSVTRFLPKNINNNNIIFLSDNLKVALRLLPIWITLLMYAVIFTQPITFFTKQGSVMKRSIGAKFEIPPAGMQSTITLTAILSTPLYDKIFVPLARVVTRNEKGLTKMQRIGVGLALSLVTMVIAALVEEKRLRTPSISIFWLLPQNIILGVSEIFTVVGMQEFFYGEVSSKMKTTGLALYISVFGVGSFVSALMISVIELFTARQGRQSWFSDDMSKARLDKYYWLIAIMTTLSMLVYVVLCKLYKGSKHGVAQTSA